MNKLEPNKQRSDNAIILIWIVLALEIVSLIFGCYNYILLRTIADGGQVSIETVNASDTINEIISTINLTVWISLAVIFIEWFRCAYSNLHQKAIGLLYTENWAIYCWFVPILCFYRPYKIMKELFCKTEDLLIEKRILSNEHPSTLHLLGWWWVLFIIANFIGGRIGIAGIYSLGAETIDQLITSNLISIFSNILSIPLALITIKVIKNYSKLESLLINEDEYKELNATLLGTVIKWIKKYYNLKECFKGKIKRKEFILISFVFGTIAVFLVNYLENSRNTNFSDTNMTMFFFTIAVAFLIAPLLWGALVKRLHDVGFYGFLPILVFIIMGTAFFERIIDILINIDNLFLMILGLCICLSPFIALAIVPSKSNVKYGENKIEKWIKKYYNPKECFKGKIKRKEFILISLFIDIIAATCIFQCRWLPYPLLIDIIAPPFSYEPLSHVCDYYIDSIKSRDWLLIFAIIIPLRIGAFVKRLHDMGIYGFWKLLVFFIIRSVVIHKLYSYIIFYLVLAIIPSKRGYKEDLDETISDFTEAIRLKPNLAYYYLTRGDTYRHEGDNYKAIADYESALQIYPDYCEARNALENLKKKVQ